MNYLRLKLFNSGLSDCLPSAYSFVRQSSCPEYLCLSVLLISVSWSGAIQAKEIYFQPSINIRTEYDDNKRLENDRFNGIDKSAYGVIIRANANLGVRSSSYDIALNNQLLINRYDSDFDLDSEDFKTNLISSFKLTERNILGLNGNYTRDTTLTSELDVTGLVQENLTREQWSVTPSWQYSLSETQFLQTNYRHSQVDYEESDRARFFDYTTDMVSLNYSQQWTELLRSSLSASAMIFDVPDLDRETTEYSINIGVDYQLSPTWSTSLTVGGRFTNTKQPGLVLINGLPVIVNGVPLTETKSSDTQGLIFSFSLNKQFEVGQAGISYSRSTSAQGNGQLQLVDRFAANFSHKIYRNLQFSVNGGINVTSTSVDQNNNDDRTYYYITPSFNWLFDRHTSLSLGYRYRMQDIESNDDSADSNTVFLNLNYQWDKFSTQKY